MNQNSISTRVSQSTIEYLEINYKNKFQGARMFLEAFPVLREESIKVLKKVFEEDEWALLILSHKNEVYDGRELASRRLFEGMLADYYDDNKELHKTVDFNNFIKKIRGLGCMERFVVRDISYGYHINPKVTEDLFKQLQ